MYTCREEIFGFDIEGSIYFTNGYLNGFNTFQRIGDAYADVGLGTVDLRVGLLLSNLAGGFEAGVDFNGLGWSLDPSFTLSLGVTLGVIL
jgi:hypothetical protein